MPSLTATPAANDAYVERLNRVLDHVAANLHRRLKLKELARIGHFSPFHFHRVFQAMVGETPSEFVKRSRLEKALSMMSLQNAPPLTRIASNCGFSSSSDFTRSFKQRYGSAPRKFDFAAWRKNRGGELDSVSPEAARRSLEARPDIDASFRVSIRELPPRQVAYIRVDRPYRGDAVFKAIKRLEAWAERNGKADGQWLGYQWENPEIAALDDCRYYCAVEAAGFTPRGEIGRQAFPKMTVADVEIRGGIDLELRALRWLYGSWLPKNGWFPDDHPSFEAWIGRPFAHGLEHFEINVQLPVRRM
jgi:AraC family transcriptional regulator